jgi:lysophospholipase L1-like esterase
MESSSSAVQDKRRVVLFGDSVFDNVSYTDGAPSTRAHLADMLGPEWAVELAAVDGAMMGDVTRQLAICDPGLDVVGVLSVGGNDLLRHLGLLGRPDLRHPFDELMDIADRFQRSYRLLVEEMQRTVPNLILCTIYEARLEPDTFARRLKAPLAVINDRIISVASDLGLAVLDLRAVCTTSADFTKQIEPSGRGARKIAEAIAHVLRFKSAPAIIYRRFSDA